MKCSTTEKNIYLYQELTPAEKTETDQHLQSCEACRELMAMVNTARDVTAILKSNPIIPDASALTHRIMNGNQTYRTRLVDALREMFSIQALRYASATLSLILVLFFVEEARHDGTHLRQVANTVSQGGPSTELNLAAFHISFFEARKSATSKEPTFSSCLSACARLNSRPCHECTSKFLKK